jgi:hypothetical protein
MESLFLQVKDYWLSEGVQLRPGASEDGITEKRLRCLWSTFGSPGAIPARASGFCDSRIVCPIRPGGADRHRSREVSDLLPVPCSALPT